MGIDASPLTGQRVLVLGTGGIGSAVAAIVADAGGRPVIAGRDPQRAARRAAERGASAVTVDLADERSVIDGLAAAGAIDHVVSTANAGVSGPASELHIAAVDRAVRAKLGGAILLAKHAAPGLPPHGSMTFFSGFVAWRPAAGQSVTAMTNGGLASLAAALAVELAPRRVNVVSPGVIDSGAWDRLGDQRDAFFARSAASVPAGRVGRPEDVAQAVLLALTNSFITGSVLHVDGGARWA